MVVNARSTSVPSPLLERQTSGVAPLVDFQVYEPVLTPSGAAGECTQLLMDHVFAYSYGHPFIGILARAIGRSGSVDISRAIHSSGLRLQQSDYKFHGD